jgi:aldose 1-epimerase
VLATNTHQALSANPGIPDGRLLAHAQVPAANRPFALHDEAAGATVPLDDCFVCAPDKAPGDVPLDTRSEGIHLLAEIRSGQTGISLRVESSEPAFQCYTGGFIDVPAWPAGDVGGEPYAAGPGFAKHAGLCIEPSRWVNAAGRQDWRAMVLLKKGGVYGARTRYTAWKD